MKIEYVKGDLFSTPHKNIAHGCNSRGVMGSGVAKIVRDRFPMSYDFYRHIHMTSGLKLGSNYQVFDNGKNIIHMITQPSYGRDGKQHVDYKAIESCFQQLNDMFLTFDWVALPKIGAGLGGGDWDIISTIIEKHSHTYQPVVYEL